MVQLAARRAKRPNAVCRGGGACCPGNSGGSGRPLRAGPVRCELTLPSALFAARVPAPSGARCTCTITSRLPSTCTGAAVPQRATAI